MYSNYILEASYYATHATHATHETSYYATHATHKTSYDYELYYDLTNKLYIVYLLSRSITRNRKTSCE